MKQVDGQSKEIGRKILVIVTKKLLLIWFCRTFKRRCCRRNLTEFLNTVDLPGEPDERVLPDDRVIPFQGIQIIGIPPVPFFIGIILTKRMLPVIAIPIGIAGSPTVGNGHKMTVLLHVDR